MKGVYFHGRQLIKPQAASFVDAEEMVRSSVGATGTIGIIGEAIGGEPGVVQNLLNPVTARGIFRGGELLDGIEILYDPASNTDKFPGAYRVKGIRVNPATHAEFQILDTGSAHWIKETTVDWGAAMNQIRQKVEPGTVNALNEGVDGFKLTINDTLRDIYEIADNLGPAFKIKYVGDATTAILTSTDASFNVVLTGQTDGSEDLTIDLTKTSYDTVLELVNYINTFNPFYEAVILGDNNLPTAQLDAFTGVSVKTNFRVITGYKAAFMMFFGTESQLVTAVFNGTAGHEPQLTGWEFFTAGSEGTTTNTSWQEALDALTMEDVDILVLMSDNESIQMLGKSHINYMSGTGRRERTMPMGFPLADEKNIQKVLTRARNFNSSRCVLAVPGIMRYDRYGELRQRSSVYTACAYAGMAACCDIAEPLTFDYINAVGLTTRYKDEDIDQLLVGGVSPVEFVQNKGYRIVQSITTYLQNDNTLYREWSVQRIADAISKDVRSELEDSYVGTAGYIDKAKRIKDTVKNLLIQFTAIGRIVSYTEPVVVITGGVAYVDYSVSPVEPINYILITTHFKQSRISA